MLTNSVFTFVVRKTCSLHCLLGVRNNYDEHAYEQQIYKHAYEQNSSKNFIYKRTVRSCHVIYHYEQSVC